MCILVLFFVNVQDFSLFLCGDFFEHLTINYVVQLHYLSLIVLLV